MAYDLRHLLGVGIDDIGKTVSYREAVLLVAVLMREPESWLQAAVNGWQYPVSRDWVVAAHTYDLHAAVNSGKGSKPKPYPNPFPDKNRVKVGNANKRSAAEVRELLAKMNPKEP